MTESVVTKARRTLRKAIKRRVVEPRTRVTFFVPSGTSGEIQAIKNLLEYLGSQRRSVVPITGYTHSPLDTPFLGKWWSDSEKRWIEDHVVFFTIDYIVTDSKRFERTMQNLRDAITRSYADSGSPQEEVWIISQRATRH